MDQGFVSKHHPKKPTFILQFFGCCGEESLRRDRKNKNISLVNPTTHMDLRSVQNHHSLQDPYRYSHPLDTESIDHGNPNDNDPSSKHLSNMYPVHEVFLLGKKNKIVAMLTRKKFSHESSLQASLKESGSSLIKENIKNQSQSNISFKAKWSNLVKNCASAETKKDAFLKEEKGTSSNVSYQAASENLNVYLASRLKCNLIIDAICGFGEFTRQLAHFSNFVIGVDEDIHKLYHAKSQAEQADLDHKIDFVSASFLQTHNIRADVVFLDPIDVRKTFGEEFSIFEDMSPNLIKLVSKASKISDGRVVLKLPGDTNLEDLSKLFDCAIDEEDKNINRFCIEIEEIINSSQETEHLIVYFGDCSSIEMKEEYGIIYDYLASFHPPKWRFKFQFEAIGLIIDKVGYKRSLRYIAEIEQLIANKIQLPSSFFDAFMEKAISDKTFTRQNLTLLIKEETKKPSSYIFSIANSYTSNLTILQRSQSGASFQYNLVDTVEENEAKRGKYKKDRFDVPYSVQEIPADSPYLSHIANTQPRQKSNYTRNIELSGLSNTENNFFKKNLSSLKDMQYSNSVYSHNIKNSISVSNLEPSLSSNDGDYMEVLSKNIVSNTGMIENKLKSEIVMNFEEQDMQGRITENGGNSSQVIVDPSEKKSERVGENGRDYHIDADADDDFGSNEDKENEDNNADYKDGKKTETEPIKKNVFMKTKTSPTESYS